MTPPNLTPEQKEHVRIAQRAHLRIEETWTLFAMFLSQGDKPRAALERAQEAVSVWAEFQDSNEVEFPDIPRRSIGDEASDAMKQMVETLRLGIGAAPVGLVAPPTEEPEQ